MALNEKYVIEISMDTERRDRFIAYAKLEREKATFETLDAAID